SSSQQNTETEYAETEYTAGMSSDPVSAMKTQNFLVPEQSAAAQVPTVSPEPDIAEVPDLPDLVEPDPLVEPEPIVGSQSTPNPVQTGSPQISPQPSVDPESENVPEFETFTGQGTPAPASASSAAPSAPPISTPPPAVGSPATQLQILSFRLRHAQTDTSIEIPRDLSVVRIGKPNEHTPPDIDVSGFPNSEIVSRVHANLRVEGDTYYLEDVGSSNGTYINGLPLATGNRHRLRSGDRIALGKGDKVSFIFETAR
ncbi:MAG: FHA domain-containing protein, partial [Cyanobacteria bacterium J06632_3]